MSAGPPQRVRALRSARQAPQPARPAGFASRSGITRAPRGLQLGETRFGGVEHLPLVGTAGLQRLHVVLDGNHRIGQSLEARRAQRLLVGTHDRAQRATDPLHDFDGALLAQHQQPGRDPAHELRHLVESLCLGGRRQGMRHRFLDPRHVDDALAQHGFLHEAELLVRRLARRIGGRRVGQDQPHELRVETVLDGDQGRRDAEQRRVVRRDAALDDRLQRIEFAFDARAQRSRARARRACR